MTRPLSTTLKNHYATSPTTLATCWKATLTNGTILRATSHDTDLEYPSGSGEIYQSVAAFSPTDVVSTGDLSVDNLELSGFLASPSITDDDVLSGIWDYAAIEMFEVNYRNLSAASGRNLIRRGTLGEVKASRSKFNVELRGLMQKLSSKIVKLCQKECPWDLGDANCQVDLTPFTVTGTLTDVTSQRLFLDESRTEDTNWFTGGLLTWTGGDNIGLQMEVKHSTSSGIIELHQSMPFPVQIGDTYSMYAGCTKRFTEDCIGKFSNGVNFGGFPHLPLSSAFNGPASV